MQSDILTIILAFFEGLALIASPCILPILPIILSGSLVGSKKRPLGIIMGFIFTFAIFTFFSRELVKHTGIDLIWIRDLSYALLILLGIIMMSSYLTEKMAYLMRRFENAGSTIAIANNQQSGFAGGFIFGTLVGVIWTPCAGPILAAVIVQTVLQETTIASFLTILSFSIGAAIPMLVIAVFGRKIMNKLSFIKTHAEWIRKILGGVIILAVCYMIYGMNLTFAVSESTNQTQTEVKNGLGQPYPAEEFGETTDWINSSPLKLSQLRGKVVLIDFWTYSCINCLRTLPYLKDWYQKYHSRGFEIIGVHSPEFEFEKNLDNVKHAVVKYGIKYPVVLDNQFVTWRRYKNNYWPAHYLINKNGDVVYVHFGEGAYDLTENNIRYLLGLNLKNETPRHEERSLSQTPETYLGYLRADEFKSPEKMVENITAHYSFPLTLEMNQWALQGDWKIEREKIVSTGAGAIIKIRFSAKKVFVVMGNENGLTIPVTVLLDGKPVVSDKGSDVTNSEVSVNGHRLFDVIDLKKTDHGILQLIPKTAGLEVYTFTFGN